MGQSRALLRQSAAAVAGLLSGFPGTILADTGGRIEHLALQFGNREFDGDLPETARAAVLSMYETLVENMDPRTRFTMVAADPRGARDLAVRFSDNERVTIVLADSEKGFSIWIRDSMIPVRDQQGRPRVVVQDRSYFAGPDEQAVPYLVGVPAESHPSLRLDGGNILSNSRQAFVGIDSVEHTRERIEGLQKRHPEAVADLVKLAGGWDGLPRMLMESELGKPVMVVGRDDPNSEQVETQPAFHIDMVATPIGDQNFMVGDPGFAIAELQKLSPKERAEVNRTMAAAACLPEDEDLVGKLIEQNSCPELQQNFDNLARELSADHQVERVPCLLGQRYGHEMPYLTYNNCIMEDYRDERGERVRKVYLPQYGCEPLDRIARQAYQKHGFEIVPLEMAAITRLAGAIRCSSYALQRA